MSGGILPVVSGLACGPFVCVAHPAPPIPRGQSRTLTHHAAPNSVFAIGIGLPPAACVPVGGGIGNYVMLGTPIITLGIGVTGGLLPGSPCAQGTGTHVLTVPAGAPIGVLFNVQSLGISPASGQVALSHAIGTATAI